MGSNPIGALRSVYLILSCLLRLRMLSLKVKVLSILIGDLTNAIKAEEKAHQPFVTMEMKASCEMRV